MTGNDIDRLFELLAIFRPGDKHLEDRKLRSAWLLVLKPYSVEDVREAVASYFREKRYWPEVTEIATRCPNIESRQKPRRVPPPETFWERWVSRNRQLEDRRREAGFPGTWSEAKDRGYKTMTEYEEAMDEAGLGLEITLDNSMWP